MCNGGEMEMSKIRVTLKKEYIVEWDDGRPFKHCCLQC